MPLKRDRKEGKDGRKRKIKQRQKTQTSNTVDTDKEPKGTTANITSSLTLRPMEKLLSFLRSPVVCRKKVHGVRVTERILEQLTPQEIRDLRFVFEMFDANSDGYLGPVDVWQALRTLGFTISRTEAVQLVQDVNFGKRNQISLSEFLEIVIDRQGDPRDSDSEIMKVFTLLDLDSTGLISVETLQQVCREARIPLSQKELDEMIEEADMDGDGRIDRAEFLRIMLKTSLF